MPLAIAELEPLLRLALVEGIGPGRLARLISAFGDAEAVIRSPVADLRQIPRIGPELARRIRAAASADARQRTSRALRRLAAVGASVLTPHDVAYPTSFSRLVEPPFLLFAIGSLDAFERSSIAVVGTRTPTLYGQTAARDLSRDLSAAGFAIISGLARGIDTAAHQGALAAGGVTVAVLGHGIEQIYPPENRQLFRDVGRSGLLLTEYPPGETPKPGNFPRRNRLITALAEAVLVVEMGHKSGAQHTVSYALEQGKEVFAVPGPIGSEASEGTNQLIRDGAPIVTSARDVIEELRGVGRFGATTSPASFGARGSSEQAIPDDPQENAPRRGPIPLRPRGRPNDGREPPGGSIDLVLPLLTPIEQRILGALSAVPAHIDEIASAAETNVQSALAALLGLELRGLVGAHPGKLFVRT